MGLFTRRKKNGGAMKTIVLSTLTPHRSSNNNDRFQRQENSRGDFTNLYSVNNTDRFVEANGTNTIETVTDSTPKQPIARTNVETESTSGLTNRPNVTTPTASISHHDRDTDSSSSCIAFPPTLLRRTVGFPTFVRHCVGSSSTIHESMNTESFGTSTHSDVVSEKNSNLFQKNSKSKGSTNATEVYSRSLKELESDRILLTPSTPSTSSRPCNEDTTTGNDSFDESEAMVFLTDVANRTPYNDDNNNININEDATANRSNHVQEMMTMHQWFPSTICLLTLDNDRSPCTTDLELAQKTKSSWMKFFVPVPQCIVRNSSLRHVRYHSSSSSLSSNNSTKSTIIHAAFSNDTGRTTSMATSTIWNRFRSENQYVVHNKDTSSMILHDPIVAKQVIMDFCLNKNYNGAIVIAKNLLRHYQSILSQTQTNTTKKGMDVGQQPQTTTPSILDHILVLRGQITLLCLVAGRNGEAMRYSTEAVRSLKHVSDMRNATISNTTTTGRLDDDSTTNDATTNDDTDGNNTVHSVQAVDTLLLHGLVLFSTNKVGQAMKAYLEAFQIAIAMNGYDDTIVSVLLCNIGVVHLQAGDHKASVRSLEESLEVQRSILRIGTEARQLGSADEAIHRLAITMCNLAVAYEGLGQTDRTISLLEESMSLYDSVELDTSVDEELVRKHLQMIFDQHQECEKRLDDTMLNTSDEAEDGIICQFYSLNESGHSDAVRSFLTSTFNNDDEGEDRNENDDDQSDSSERSVTLFGNSDGVPSNKVRPWLWLEESDNHDFLLLGALQPELSAEQRVRDTVLFWNGGKDICNDDTGEPVGVGTDTTGTRKPSKRNIEILKYNLNFNGETVVDADLHLNEIHKQAMIYLDDNKIDAAIDILNGAVRSHCAKYGTKHHLVGSAMHNIGMVLFFAQRYSEALAAFENAVLIRDESLHSNHPDIQSSCIKIALIHLAMGNTHRAHDVFSDIRDKLLQNLKGYGLVQLAKVNNNIGVIAYEFNDLDNALESFKAAYDCQRQIWKKCKLDEKRNQNDTNSNESCYWHVIKFARANTLCNMAFIYVKVGDYDRGLELYDHAYSILYRLLPKHHPIIVNVISNIDLLLEAINNDV